MSRFQRLWEYASSDIRDELKAIDDEPDHSVQLEKLLKLQAGIKKLPPPEKGQKTARRDFATYLDLRLRFLKCSIRFNNDPEDPIYKAALHYIESEIFSWCEHMGNPRETPDVWKELENIAKKCLKEDEALLKTENEM